MQISTTPFIRIGKDTRKTINDLLRHGFFSWLPTDLRYSHSDSTSPLNFALSPCLEQFLYLNGRTNLILGKVTKFLVKKFSTSEVINQKPHRGEGGGGGGGEHPTVP